MLLYARRLRVQWRFGLLLAAGALVGAAVGVQLAHLDGAAAFGKRLLGVVNIHHGRNDQIRFRTNLAGQTHALIGADPEQRLALDLAGFPE